MLLIPVTLQALIRPGREIGLAGLPAGPVNAAAISPVVGPARRPIPVAGRAGAQLSLASASALACEEAGNGCWAPGSGTRDGALVTDDDNDHVL
jgi:hypothetical protein